MATRRGRGGNTRSQRRLNGLERHLREELSPFPRLVRRSQNLLDFPTINEVFRAKAWNRFTAVKPATGDWNITVANVVTALAFPVLSTQLSFRIERIRIMFPPSTSATAFGSVLLQVGVANSPIQNSKFTYLVDRAAQGVSIACVDVDLPRAWRTMTFQSGDTNVISRILSSSQGVVQITEVVVDVLLDISVYGGTLGSSLQSDPLPTFEVLTV